MKKIQFVCILCLSFFLIVGCSNGVDDDDSVKSDLQPVIVGETISTDDSSTEEKLDFDDIPEDALMSVPHDAFSYSVILVYTDDEVTITSNGLPDHETGDFPNDGNPNTITEQDIEYTLTINPQKASAPTYISLGAIGIALNGIKFDPGAAEFYNNDRDSGWQYDALSSDVNLGLDFNNAHVQPTGAYHYHGVPEGLVDESEMQLIGFAADGFPIYHDDSYSSSWKVKSGTRSSGPGGSYDGTYVEDYEYVAGSGDLDECNGIELVTDDYAESTYLYIVTDAFPSLPRCLMGTVHESFSEIGGAAGNGYGGLPPPNGQRPPPPKR